MEKIPRAAMQAIIIFCFINKVFTTCVYGNGGARLPRKFADFYPAPPKERGKLYRTTITTTKSVIWIG